MTLLWTCCNSPAASAAGGGMSFDLDGPKPAFQARGEAEPAQSIKPPAALPAPAPDPKKPSGGGKPTLRRIK